jgi:hypothetical protein
MTKQSDKPKVYKPKHPEICIGHKVILKYPILGIELGSVGYIVALRRPILGLGAARDVMVIFEDGACETFSDKDARKNLTIGLEPDIRYCDYEYTNMADLEQDFQNGFWRFHRRNSK